MYLYWCSGAINVVQDIFWTHLVKQLNSFNIVLIMNNTYKNEQVQDFFI